MKDFSNVFYSDINIPLILNVGNSMLCFAKHEQLNECISKMQIQINKQHI